MHCWLNVCSHPGFIEQAFSSHPQKYRTVSSSDHGYFKFCLEIRISHFLKMFHTLLFLAPYLMWKTLSTFYILCLHPVACLLQISCSNCLASQYKLIVTGSCKTKKILMILYLHRNKITEKRINCSDMKHFMTHCVQYHLDVGFGVASILSIFLVHSVYFVWSVRVLHSCIS